MQVIACFSVKIVWLGLFIVSYCADIPVNDVAGSILRPMRRS